MKVFVFGQLLVLALLFSPASHADTVVTDKFDSGTGPLPDDQFGFALDSDGDRVIVGIPGRSLQSGAAQVFELQPGGNGYNYVDEFLPASEAVQRAGFSVAIGKANGIHVSYTDWAVLGVPFDDTPSAGGANSGTARLYGLDATTSWIAADTLFGNDMPNQNFGTSLSIASGRLIVGGPGTNGSTGEVTVYQENVGPFCVNCWSQQQVIQQPSPLAGDDFGEVVDFAGPECERFAAYAPGRNISGGEVLIYEFDLLGNSEWDLQQTVVLPGVFFNVNHGSTAIDCNSMAFSALGLKVSVFHRDLNNDYISPFTIEAVPGAHGFGASLDIAGDRLIIGAPQSDSSQGAAYYYHRIPDSDSWTLETRFVPPASSGAILFGQSVHMAGNMLLIGAYGGGSLSGAVYFLDLDDYTPNVINVPALPPVGLVVVFISLIGLGYGALIQTRTS